MSGVLFVIDQLGQNLARLTDENESLRAALAREEDARRRLEDALAERDRADLSRSA